MAPAPSARTSSRACARPWSCTRTSVPWSHLHGHGHTCTAMASGHASAETSVRLAQIKRQSNSLKYPGGHGHGAASRCDGGGGPASKPARRPAPAARGRGSPGSRGRPNPAKTRRRGAGSRGTDGRSRGPGPASCQRLGSQSLLYHVFLGVSLISFRLSFVSSSDVFVFSWSSINTSSSSFILSSVPAVRHPAGHRHHASVLSSRRFRASVLPSTLSSMRFRAPFTSPTSSLMSFRASFTSPTSPSRRFRTGRVDTYGIHYFTAGSCRQKQHVPVWLASPLSLAATRLTTPATPTTGARNLPARLKAGS